MKTQKEIVDILIEQTKCDCIFRDCPPDEDPSPCRDEADHQRAKGRDGGVSLSPGTLVIFHSFLQLLTSDLNSSRRFRLAIALQKSCLCQKERISPYAGDDQPIAGRPVAQKPEPESLSEYINADDEMGRAF